MHMKLQHFGANCFHILGTKTSPNIAIPVPPLDKVDPIKKYREHKVLEIPNGGAKRFGRIYRKPHDRSGNKRGKEGGKNSLVEKTHAKCSTKWAFYGGCIPSILEALETIRDLDEALMPWEKDLNNKERSIILKEQSSWERALEIFEWFKKKGCYEVNVIHYNIMLRILGKARKWSLVEGMWDEMKNIGITPINSTYGTLIDVYSKGGCKEEALHWLELMDKQGMEPDEVTMGTIVQMYKKAGEFKKAERFFMKWSSGKTFRDKARSAPTTTNIAEGSSRAHVCLSSYTYNTLIDTYGKAGQLREASETFARMLSDGIVPNIVTFNTMIHICGNNDQLEEVASLMQKMEELQCPFDTRTFNILISLHAKHDNIEMAARYFAKMKENRLVPDLVSYRTLLYAFSIRLMVGHAEDLVSEMDERGLEVDEFTQSALTRMYIEAGMLEKSWLWFKRFHLKGNMSSECCSANIDAFGERGYVLEAEKAFLCCQEEKNISVVEFNVMIKAYGIGKRYDQACRLFDSMGHHGVVPDRCSYNSLIQILASADLPHIALPYVRKMEEAGLVSDCIAHCALISSFAKLGQLEMAVGLFKDMIAHSVQPDIVVYGVLINAFADIGGVKEAIGYVDGIRNSGLPMNAVIYNSLIKLYVKVGYLKEAQETYELLKSSTEGPDLYSSNCMIDLYSKRSMVKQAETIFESLRRKGDTNEFSFAMMLCMYKRVGRFEEAIRIAQEMRELGLLTDLLSYNNVLGLYAMDGRFKEAAETFKEMIEMEIKPDDSTFKSLGVLLVKCGVSKKAVGMLEVTRSNDAHRGLQAWISTLFSVVGEDYDDDND